jgi:hypothetical protein
LVGDPLGDFYQRITSLLSVILQATFIKAFKKNASHSFGFCISCQRLQASLRVSLKYKSLSLS